MSDYPNIDGVIALTHKGGCGLDAKVDGIQSLQRCIAGYAAHPPLFAQMSNLPRSADEVIIRSTILRRRISVGIGK